MNRLSPNTKTGSTIGQGDLIKLSVADPGFDTPEYIEEALQEGLRKGYTHYSGTRGLVELREAL